MPDTAQVDNPYEHTKLAQQYELQGDFRHAEIRYKKAITASDQLPLGEYKEHLNSNVAKITW